MNVFVDVDYGSINKYQEELCGDKVEVLKNKDSVIVVLADGLGSGVKANILATLTSKIIGTMLSLGATIDEAVETVVSTLPVSRDKGIAYSSFSILQVYEWGQCYLFEFDNPSVIRLVKGAYSEVEGRFREINGKLIKESSFSVSPEDVLILVSDGAIHAGIGHSLNLGWKWENLKFYTEKNCRKDMDAKKITSLLLAACDNLYDNMPGDDTTVVAVKIKSHVQANVMFGPPSHRSIDSDVVNKFMKDEGKKIVCGGTTAQMVARETGKKLVTSLYYIDSTVPPAASIEGIDLTTEGILTMSKALEYAKKYSAAQGNIDNQLNFSRQDGASNLAKLLIEECTSVHFFVGCARNPAHQNPDLPLNFSLKLKLVDDMRKCLESLGKKVVVDYY